MATAAKSSTCDDLYTLQTSGEPSDSSCKTRMLRVKERKALSAGLRSLDKKSICSKVVTTVDCGLHFSCYPERKAFWDSIRSSTSLQALIDEATEEFARLYLTHDRGPTKYVRFLRAWLQYMLTFTGDQPASQKTCTLRAQLAECYSQPVSEDTRRVVICDILHTLQLLLQTELVTKLKGSHQLPSEGVRGSDDTALYRIGGWAIHALVRRTATLKEEKQLLEAMKLPDKDKIALPPGLRYLDRGGLTFPKQELLPYLRLVEERILDLLNKDNYRRYGQRLFEVTKKIITDDITLLQAFTEVVTQLIPTVASTTVRKVHEVLLGKIYNCRCNEYLKSLTQEVLSKQKKSVDVHVGLRDELKTYASNKQL